MKRCIAAALSLVFAFSLIGCVKPSSTNTAKTVVSKASFYVGLAQTLVSVAKTHYKDNADVKKCVEATEKALVALQSTMFLITSGLEKDYGLLASKLVTLIESVHDLTKAIQDAKKATS